MTNSTLDRWLLGAAGLVALLIVAIGLTVLNTWRLNEDAGWVAHTHEVMDKLEEVNGHLREAETVQRTYLIVGGDTIPPDFAANIESATQKLGTVKLLTEDNPEQQGHIPDIEKRTEELKKLWSHTMAVRQTRNFDEVKTILTAGESRTSMAELQAKLRQMDATERVLLRERSAKRKRTYYWAVGTGLLLGWASVAGVVAFMALLRRHLADRLAAATVIAEQSERLRTTLASIGDAVITTDIQGRITSMNAVAESLTGWTKEEATGQPLDEVFRIVNEETRRGVENPATRALNEGVIVGLANHTVLIARQGTERPIDDSAAPIRCREGQIVGCVLVFRDVTQRRRQEDHLRKLAADLSDADRRKDEFLATLAHELRNPLAPIRNALQLFRLATDRETKEKARIVMERQLEQMVRLVDDLLDVSRITRGRLELRKEPVHLSAVVGSAVETSRPMIDHLGHELTIALPEQPIVLDADLTRLAQVFSNLLNNSAKYTNRGGRIRLTAERQGSDVVVSVKDTGIGISAEQLPRLFQMFSQAEHALERSQGGLGIGLTLVKRLVEMHDGRVEVYSAGLGKGSEFVVRLPIVVDPRGPRAARAKEEEAPKSALRILIVDDNRDSADSLAMLLRILGNDTRTAYDGQEGLEVAETFRPAVMLLDIGLPKLNGYEACRRIRDQSWGKNVVLIAVTGWGQEEDRRLSHEAGFDRHMVKPVDPQELMKLLAGLPQGKP
ncbi:MAG TPA: ATP-binding protein [Gemmataceae bacterium]